MVRESFERAAEQPEVVKSDNYGDLVNECSYESHYTSQGRNHIG